MRMYIISKSKKQVPPHHKVWFEQPFVFRMPQNSFMEFWGPENLYEIFFGSEKDSFKRNCLQPKGWSLLF